MTDTGDRPGRLAARIGGGAWAVADQALYAGANFAVNVALARALAPEAYGAFTTAFIAFLLLGAVHGGLLIEPVLNPVWAWVFQGERPGMWALVGGGVILGATTLRSVLDARRPPEQAALPAG